MTVADTLALIDAKGLVREAYRIEGITEAECRSIFMDWALSLPADHRPIDAVARLLEIYAPDHPAHPMTDVLRAGLVAPSRSGRRGGWRGRREPSSEA